MAHIGLFILMKPDSILTPTIMGSRVLKINSGKKILRTCHYTIDLPDEKKNILNNKNHCHFYYHSSTFNSIKNNNETKKNSRRKMKLNLNPISLRNESEVLLRKN